MIFFPPANMKVTRSMAMIGMAINGSAAYFVV